MDGKELLLTERKVVPSIVIVNTLVTVFATWCVRQVIAGWMVVIATVKRIFIVFNATLLVLF